MLPQGDHTPGNFRLPEITPVERIKRPIRKLLYPLLNLLTSRGLGKRYGTGGFCPDYWLWGQRGNDYPRLRSRVNRALPLRGKNILIAGCGTGRDLPSWLEYRPARLTGVDWFDYDRAWQMVKQQAAERYPSTRLEFRQGDLEHLTDFGDGSFDIIGSDAVFEHLSNFDVVLREMFRVLRPGGVLYATFGPLWYSWGGDHISGFDVLANGYNHILLDDADYKKYLASAGEHQHSEHDGRTWIENELFSYLRPREYLEALSSAGFERISVGAIVEPRAVKLLETDKELAKHLSPRASLIDQIVTGMTILYRKPG